MENQLVKQVASALPAYQSWQVEAALQLMDEGNTIPFIARYRKEKTGTLDEVALQEIQTS
ncbi:Tex-like N-terminal domain-containing protein, partial [Limosilactobacillus ingluviei]